MSRPSPRPAVLRVIAALLCLASLVAACSSGPTDAIRVVAPETAAELLAADPAPILIDVRTPDEYAAGHLEGAQLIDYNGGDFEARIAELPRDAAIVIYCRSGNRSAGARAVMAELGFADVADIEGGILAWTDAGLPTTTG